MCRLPFSSQRAWGQTDPFANKCSAHGSQYWWPHSKTAQVNCSPSPSSRRQTTHSIKTRAPSTPSTGTLASSSSSSSSLTIISASLELTSSRMSKTAWLSISSRSFCSNLFFCCFLYFANFQFSKKCTDLSMSWSAVIMPARYLASLAAIILREK